MGGLYNHLAVKSAGGIAITQNPTHISFAPVSTVIVANELDCYRMRGACDTFAPRSSSHSRGSSGTRRDERSPAAVRFEMTRKGQRECFVFYALSRTAAIATARIWAEAHGWALEDSAVHVSTP